MADQWTGKSLAVSVDSVSLPCPQSFEISGQHEFVEYYCVGTAGKQRVYDGTNWTGSSTFFPEDDDYTILSGLNETTAIAVIAYPDGNTSGKIKVTFNAFCSVGLTTQRSSVGSATVTFTVDGDVTFGSATGS
jgi:hypothetical protein